MHDMTAESVSQAFLSSWVSQFGVPLVITSDRGRQFISHLWSGICNALGSKVQTTTAFHAQSNGMVERFHRTFKASLMAKLSHTEDWVKELLAVLLGIRTAFRDEIGCSIAEVVLGLTYLFEMTPFESLSLGLTKAHSKFWNVFQITFRS